MKKTTKKRGPTPRLEIHPGRITANAKVIVGLCKRHGITISGVTKVTCAHPAIIKAYLAAGLHDLADSRVANLRSIRKAAKKPRSLLLTRLPTVSEARDVVSAATQSLVSHLETIEALGAAARAARKRHQVIVMVELGDLREGAMPDRAIEIVTAAKDVRGIEVVGVGANLACFGGVIPSREILGKLVELANFCRNATGLELPIVSGGNSSTLPLLLPGAWGAETADTPLAGITHLRVGETILLGTNVIDRSPFPGTRQDAFTVVGEIIELEHKPSMPAGARGQDAFGGRPEFKDRGIRARAIVNIGRQDAVLTGLKPLDAGVEVLGGSSDHLIVDVEDCERQLKVGDELSFTPDYGALLALSTSAYVTKVVVKR